ncbi:MAG: D-2-hydroxyacid dehydrogenase [Clostridiales bacterium]|nr:D-2-hydroxyacid dehydrogenase [Clostridiales bacterium]
MRIVILDASAANPGDLSWAPLERFGEVIPYDVTKKEQLIERAQGAEILFTNKTVFEKEDFDKLPDLRYIGVLATGFNVVDLEAAKAHNVCVTNVPEYATFATAQMAIALLLELADKAGIHSASVFDGGWVRSPQFCYTVSPLIELCGKTAVVVGLGKIGRRVCLILNALGMKVIGVPHTMCDSIDIDGVKIECKPLNKALKEADVITFHCPLTNETNGLLSKPLISELKKDVLIINTARGPIVNEEDIVDALLEGKIGGYAADVIMKEPMESSSPLLKLKDMPNVVLTPHIAWAPKETRKRLIDAAAANLEAFLNGDPINQVNK